MDNFARRGVSMAESHKSYCDLPENSSRERGSGRDCSNRKTSTSLIRAASAIDAADFASVEHEEFPSVAIGA